MSFRPISVLIGLLALATAGLAGFPFWLEGPGYRQNPHDPASPWFRSPTPIPPAPSFTRTASPTFTASPPATATPTFSDSPTALASPSFTQSPTPSSTATPSDTPTPSASPTVTPTFTLSPFLYYDGDAPGASFSDFSRAPWTVTPVAPPSTTILSSMETNTGGPKSGLFYARVTTRGLGFPILAGVGNAAGSVDVSSYNALSLWMRSVDGCFEPMVALHSPGSVNNGTSVFVTATAYADGPFDAGVWRHVVIPFSAFNGSNWWGNPYDLAVAGNQVDAVYVTPAWPRNYYYFSGGPYWVFRQVPPSSYATSTMDLDEVHFCAVADTSLKNFPPLFDGFVSFDGWTQWGTRWTVYMDSLACGTTATSISFPPTGYAPIDSLPSPFNSCFSGHLSGTLGSADGTGPCPGQYSYVGMQADFAPGGGPTNLGSLSGLSPTGALQGVSIWLKAGAAGTADYDLVLRKASVAALNDGAHYSHRFPAASLSATVWTRLDIPFPPSGLPGTDSAGSFGQPSWAAGAGASVPWDTNDLLNIQVIPADTARGMNFNILVGRISFY